MSHPFPPPSLPEISVQQLADYLARPEDSIQLIDVREPEELAIASLEPFAHFPLSEFAQWSPEISTRLNPHAETLVLCHHGIRSAQMCQWLISQGFTNVKNITGGIDAYARFVDRRIPKY
jgi:rhodanese-related sulfurtransferase